MGSVLPTDDGFPFLNVGDGDHLTFEVGEEHRVEQRVEEDDAEAIRQQIRAADAQSDWVVASVHAHEGGGNHLRENTLVVRIETLERYTLSASVSGRTT